MRLRQYLNEARDFKSRLKTWKKDIEQGLTSEKQLKSVSDMENKGFKIVIWEHDFVAMVDKKGNPAEVYKDGKVKYPKKR